MPASSKAKVVAMIVMRSVLIRDQRNSNISPASICVAIPKLKSNEIKKNDNVSKPMPPSWMRHKMTVLPKMVKYETGTVSMPVTQVHEVAVKKRSIRSMSVSRA